MKSSGMSCRRVLMMASWWRLPLLLVCSISLIVLQMHCRLCHEIYFSILLAKWLGMPSHFTNKIEQQTYALCIVTFPVLTSRIRVDAGAVPAVGMSGP